MKKLALILILSIVSFFALSNTASQASTAASLKSAHVGATNPGFQEGSCPTSASGSYGWHFVLPGNSTTFVSVSATFETAGVVTNFISFPTGKHAYVYTPTSDKLLGATAQVNGPETVFNLSHVCPGNGTTTTTTTTVPETTTTTVPETTTTTVATSTTLIQKQPTTTDEIELITAVAVVATPDYTG